MPPDASLRVCRPVEAVRYGQGYLNHLFRLYTQRGVAFSVLALYVCAVWDILSSSCSSVEHGAPSTIHTLGKGAIDDIVKYSRFARLSSPLLYIPHNVASSALHIRAIKHHAVRIIYRSCFLAFWLWISPAGVSSNSACATLIQRDILCVSWVGFFVPHVIDHYPGSLSPRVALSPSH